MGTPVGGKPHTENQENISTYMCCVIMKIVSIILILSFVSISTPIKCYACDGIKGENLPCDGDKHLGDEKECTGHGYVCGLLHERRLIYNDLHTTVISTEDRWRRDCATDGHELTDNSEASAGTLTGDLGCVNAGGRSENNIKIENTLCLCNTTLCNTSDHNSAPSSRLPSVFLVLAAGISRLA